jgi:hypothetical protein
MHYFGYIIFTPQLLKMSFIGRRIGSLLRACKTKYGNSKETSKMREDDRGVVIVDEVAVAEETDRIPVH